MTFQTHGHSNTFGLYGKVLGFIEYGIRVNCADNFFSVRQTPS